MHNLKQILHKNLLNEFKQDDNIKHFSDVNESNINDFLEPYGNAGFNDIEERNEWLLDRIQSIYPWGYKNIPNKLKLYRIVKLDDPKQLDINSVGKHYVNDKDLLTDDEFIRSIGLHWKDKDKFYIITVEANVDSVADLTTMVQNILNPQEEEWYLKSNPKVIGIEKLNKNKKSINENYFESKSNEIFNNIKSHKIGDVINNETLYNYINALHDFDMDNDFIKDNILKYNKFKLIELPINKLNLNSVSPDLVNDYLKIYKQTGWYPPILYDKDEGVIDGYHRLNAIAKNKNKNILAWVGIK